MHPPHGELTEEDLADLARLADGSLTPKRRAAVEARVAASPLLQAALAEQERAVRATRGLTDVAPERLQAKIDLERWRASRRGRRRLGRLAAGCAAAAAATVAAVVTLGGGAPSGPTVLEAARLARRSPVLPAPSPYRRHPALLRLEVQGLAYPNWSRRFGWRAVGARRDRLDGRRATTLFYAKGARRIAYTILSRPALRWPARGARTVRAGVEFRTLGTGGRAVVTWRRRGHTCVLSGARGSHRLLLVIGSWRAGGRIPY